METEGKWSKNAGFNHICSGWDQPNHYFFVSALRFALLCLNIINYIYVSASVNKTFAFLSRTVITTFFLLCIYTSTKSLMCFCCLEDDRFIRHLIFLDPTSFYWSLDSNHSWTFMYIFSVLKLNFTKNKMPEIPIHGKFASGPTCNLGLVFLCSTLLQ